MNTDQILQRLDELEKIWDKYPTWKFYFFVNARIWRLVISNDEAANGVKNNTVHAKTYGQIFQEFETNQDLRGILNILELYTEDLPEAIVDENAQKIQERIECNKQKEAREALERKVKKAWFSARKLAKEAKKLAKLEKEQARK